jgi:hypothetical protein
VSWKSLALPVFSSLLAFASAGCGGSPAPQPDDGVTYQRDVKPIVDAKCTGCHQPGGAGPFSLQTFAEVSGKKSAIAQAVATRQMPPWPYSDDCAEYAYDPALTKAQVATIARWVDEGGREGLAAAPPADAMKSAKLAHVDVTVRMPVPYTPTVVPDDYRCFLVDWPPDTLKYVTGFSAHPQNTQAVHHVVAFVIGPQQVAEYQAKDDADPGPGFSCYGTVGGASFTTLGSWAPGAVGDVLYPPGTGLQVVPGSKIVLQVHYNLHGQPPAPDVTTFDFQLEDTAKPATFLLTTNPQWVFAGMPIAAGDPNASYSFSADLSQGRPFTIYNVGVHMHLLGKRGVVRIERPGEEKECLVDTTWSFSHQRSYTLASSKVVRPSDRIYLECDWDNSPANQPVIDGRWNPPKNVRWGEGTGDEMCVLMMYIVRDP